MVFRSSAAPRRVGTLPFSARAMRTGKGRRRRRRDCNVHGKNSKLAFMCVMMCIHHFTSSCQYADEARRRKIKISSRKTVRRRKSENRKSVYVHSQFSSASMPKTNFPSFLLIFSLVFGEKPTLCRWWLSACVCVLSRPRTSWCSSLDDSNPTFLTLRVL